MARGKAKKSLQVMDFIESVLRENNPMTVRQVYYQCVATHLIENKLTMYNKISMLLVEMRQTGRVPWEWIEDRIRKPRQVSMWGGLESFKETAIQAYRRDVWETQDTLLEIWLEKDALSGIFETITTDYGVTLNVGRGYDGWSSIHEAAERYRAWGGPVTVYYFGDFDPSGEDMFRSLTARLAFFDMAPTMEKVALTRQDIRDYNLPPDVTKASDSRQSAFVEKWGDIAVELDALPVNVLRQRIEASIRGTIDIDAMETTKTVERVERQAIADLLGNT